MRARDLSLCFGVLAASAGLLAANPLAPQPVSPRAVARAGADVVSASGGSALPVNPAGLVRGSGLSADVALGVRAQRIELRRIAQADVANPPAYPRADSRAESPRLSAFLAASLLSGRLAFGVGVWTDAVHDADFPRAAGEPTAAITDPQRYLVRRLSLAKQSLGIGVAARPTRWLAVGAAVTVSQVRLSLARDGWGGHAADRPVFEDPRLDLPVRAGGSDDRVLGVAAGITLSPPSAPIEIALSFSAAEDALLAGGVLIDRARFAPIGYAEPIGPAGAALVTRATTPMILRAATRFQRGRADLELGAELQRERGHEWSGTPNGLELPVRRPASGYTFIPIDSIPFALSTQTRYVLHAGGELALGRGLFALRGGWAYRSAGSASAEMTAAAPEPSTHVLGFGVAAMLAGLRLEIGYQRALRTRVRIEDSHWRHWNPLDPPVGRDVGTGRISTSEDLVAVGLSIDFGPAKRAFFPPPEPPEPAPEELPPEDE